MPSAFHNLSTTGKPPKAGPPGAKEFVGLMGSGKARVASSWLICVLLASSPALAHRDGCHIRHSCETDNPGTYICGDKGACDQCKDNEYCLDRRPRLVSPPVTEAPAASEGKDQTPDQPSAARDLAAPEEFTGKVRSVTDGDTLTVQDRDRHRDTIRILGIDAPESGSKEMPGQSYSARSRQSLMKLVSGKEVRITWRSYDDFKRIAGRVWVGDADIGLVQVCAGYAWVYEEYLDDLTEEERKAYRACEGQARAERRGLWRDPRATPPWEWRRSQRGEEEGR
ncbi:MAG: thermonuclease family protein [Burkholderiales bacterium]